MHDQTKQDHFIGADHGTEPGRLSEAYMNTLKRDYENVTPTPDAVTFFGLLAGWCGNENENDQHSGPKMRSAHEFIVVQTAHA